MAKTKEDQRAEIRFCVRLGLSRKDTRDRLQTAHGAQCLSMAQINRWYSWFAADAQAKLSDLPRSHGPRKLTQKKVDDVRHAVARDKRSTLRQLAQDTGISTHSVHKVLRSTLKLSKRPARFVPHLLTDAQKDRCVRLSRGALAMLRRRRGSPHVICGDESWFWAWQPDSKQESMQWLPVAEVRPELVRQELSVRKMMLIAFFDEEGMVHHEWIPNGQGIDRHVYLNFMIQLREAVRRKRPRQWADNSWAILHDGAPAHRADIVQQWFTRHRIEQLPHPGYSPDLSPPDYWLFAQLKKMTRGHRYHNLQDLRTAVEAAMNSIPAADFASAMARYPERLRLCIQHHGAYFERK